MTERKILRSVLMFVMITSLACIGACDDDGPGDVAGPGAIDSDGDGVSDRSDLCVALPGETKYSGCPWYKVDDCGSGCAYTLSGHRWATDTPVFRYDASLPRGWHRYVDNSASRWNEVGTDLQIKKNSRVVDAGRAQDGMNVVSYGPLPDGNLGRAYIWYDTQSMAIRESDIVLNSRAALSIGGSRSSYDVYAVLVHEFGHFCGLGHVDNRFHTMTPRIPLDGTIHRTLCCGDENGLRALY